MGLIEKRSRWGRTRESSRALCRRIPSNSSYGSKDTSLLIHQTEQMQSKNSSHRARDGRRKSPLSNCCRTIGYGVWSIRPPIDLVLIDWFFLNFIFFLFPTLAVESPNWNHNPEIRTNWSHISLLHFPMNPFWPSPTAIRPELAIDSCYGLVREEDGRQGDWSVDCRRISMREQDRRVGERYVADWWPRTTVTFCWAGLGVLVR
jgi:hypothetical protein